MQNTLDPQGDPILKEYKRDQQAKPSFRSSGRTHNRHSTQTRMTSLRRPQRNTTDGDRWRTKRGWSKKTEPRQRRCKRDMRQTTEHTTPGKQVPEEQAKSHVAEAPTQGRRQTPGRKDTGGTGEEGREPNRDNPKAQNKDNPGKSSPGHGGKSKPWSRWRNLPTYCGEKAELTTSRKEKPKGHGDRPKGQAERRPEVEKEEGVESSAPKNGPKRRRRERERVGP